MPNGNNLSTKEFIARAKAIHGNLYDYSKAAYQSSRIPIIIICPLHGEFLMTPKAHIGNKRGCPYCGKKKRHGNSQPLVFGKGINDVPNGRCTIAYKHWLNMLRRCYDIVIQQKQPTYIGCEVVDEWLSFSNFKIWFDDNYQKDYQLDKDILIKGNKFYSPETCCFVPKRINVLLLRRKSARGEFPIGVCKHGEKFVAQFNDADKKIYLGTYSTPMEAFAAYKEAKEAYVKKLAFDYLSKNKIPKKVYDAIMRYEIDISD